MSQASQVIQLYDFPACSQRLKACHELYGLERREREDILAEGGPYPDVLGLMPTILNPIDDELMACFPKLKVVANYGAGVNNIDLDAATRRGVWVTNTPGVLSDSTADLTWGLILAACRRIVESDHELRTVGFHGWSPDYHLGIEVTGKTLGVIGLGDIGRAVVERAKGFRMPVRYHNRTRLSESDEQAMGANYRSLEALLSESDIVTVHTPLTDETRHMFNAETLAMMKPQSVLVNTARGPVVDEAALVAALKSGHLYAAGLDVFEREPEVHPELLTLKNAVLTAHIGSATKTTRENMGNLALDNLMAVLKGQPPLTPVNSV